MFTQLTALLGLGVQSVTNGGGSRSTTAEDFSEIFASFGEAGGDAGAGVLPEEPRTALPGDAAEAVDKAESGQDPEQDVETDIRTVDGFPEAEPGDPLAQAVAIERRGYGQSPEPGAERALFAKGGLAAPIGDSSSDGPIESRRSIARIGAGLVSDTISAKPEPASVGPASAATETGQPSRDIRTPAASLTAKGRALSETSELSTSGSTALDRLPKAGKGPTGELATDTPVKFTQAQLPAGMGPDYAPIAVGSTHKLESAEVVSASSGEGLDRNPVRSAILPIFREPIGSNPSPGTGNRRSLLDPMASRPTGRPPRADGASQPDRFANPGKGDAIIERQPVHPAPPDVTTGAVDNQITTKRALSRPVAAVVDTIPHRNIPPDSLGADDPKPVIRMAAFVRDITHTARDVRNPVNPQISIPSERPVGSALREVDQPPEPTTEPTELPNESLVKVIGHRSSPTSISPLETPWNQPSSASKEEEAVRSPALAEREALPTRSITWPTLSTRDVFGTTVPNDQFADVPRVGAIRSTIPNTEVGVSAIPAESSVPHGAEDKRRTPRPETAHVAAVVTPVRPMYQVQTHPEQVASDTLTEGPGEAPRTTSAEKGLSKVPAEVMPQRSAASSEPVAMRAAERDPDIPVFVTRRAKGIPQMPASGHSAPAMRAGPHIGEIVGPPSAPTEASERHEFARAGGDPNTRLRLSVGADAQKTLPPQSAPMATPDPGAPSVEGQDGDRADVEPRVPQPDSRVTGYRADAPQTVAAKDAQPATRVTAGVSLPVTSPFLLDRDEPPLSDDVMDMSFSEIRGSGVAPSQQTSAQLALHRSDSPAVMRQVTEAISRMAEDRVEVRLNPEELGGVRFRIQTGEHGLIVHVAADRPETLDLMRRHIDQLSRDFAEAGYDGASFSFGDDGRAGQDASRDHPGAPVEPQTSGDTATPLHPVQPQTPDEGLDIRI